MFKKIYDYLRAHLPAFFAEAARWTRYVYFMRFSLLLWFFPLLLAVLNHTKAKTLTSGLFVPEYWQGYLCVAFFLVSTGFVALISARVPVINGPARWGEATDNRPKLLKCILANDKGEYEWVAPILSQALNFYLLWYIFANASAEKVNCVEVVEGLFGGFLLAVGLWYVANAWYYLTYEVPPEHAALPHIVLGKNAARTILFPRNWFFLNKAQGAHENNTLEDATTSIGQSLDAAIVRKTTNFTAKLADLDGYVDSHGRLYEAHLFSTVAVILFGGLYAVLWPLTAPVPAYAASIAAIVLTAAAVLRIDWLFLWADRTGGGLIWWKVLFIGTVTTFGFVVYYLYFHSSTERFPILAVILILSIAMCWIFAGIAFFVDRFRLPVFTTFLLFLILPRLFGWDWGREEHYFSTFCANAAPDSVPTPAKILADRLDAETAANTDYPLIIVTSTGGGIHAAAWTTAVLARLESEFAGTDGKGEPFHKHLLLASTVSGGSVGLNAYLREVHDNALDTPNTLNLFRMQAVAQCSSLEAVGWGLVYYDLNKAIVPVIPFFFPHADGNNDLNDSPLWKDRTCRSSSC